MARGYLRIGIRGREMLEYNQPEVSAFESCRSYRAIKYRAEVRQETKSKDGVEEGSMVRRQG